MINQVKDAQDLLLTGENAAYLENIFEDYLHDGSLNIEPSLENYFSQLPQALSSMSHKAVIENIRNIAQGSRCGANVMLPANMDVVSVKKQLSILSLMQAYRSYGHLEAKTDPLNFKPQALIKELTLDYYGLSEQDFSLVVAFSATKETLTELYQWLRQVYCQNIGIEYMHMQDESERLWWQDKFEGKRNVLSKEKQVYLLELLTSAESLERYIGSKYPGAKRFSLEGGDSLILVLDEIIQNCGSHGVKEVVIGMAHRGRLNVLVNNLGKLPSDLFSEFEGKHDNTLESGDVKYHQGFSSDVTTKGGTVHLSLCFNPSHLEIVAPVALGSVRARQTRRNFQACSEVVPVIIHGDSAFSGQGVVMETFAMSQTRGFSVCGSLHLVVNNQVGFTTSNPQDTRSSTYATDIAKMIGAPIIHVNADCPEEVLWVTQLAIEYRMLYKKDVIIDLVCYRRHGHNEADEPAVTQPLMYQLIRKHPTVRQLYAEQLIKKNVLTEALTNDLVTQTRDALVKDKKVARNVLDHMTAYVFDWKPHVTQDWSVIDTGVNAVTLKELSDNLFNLSVSTSLHPRVAKIIEDRQKMGDGKLAFDWGGAEVLAYASLLSENINVRISGQDCARGTFFHRHVVLHSQDTGVSNIPLEQLTTNKAKFDVIDSLLSEEAVMAFEYGYAAADPNTLVIWEGQFGDFANGAQVVIDQFISSGEHKWGRFCALTLLLPHAYEGMGPEHTSARLERFLQLCAEKNMQVCVPSTPAQIFHLLRRQMLRKIRKPLIVMSPKSLLRHKLATSSLDDLTKGSFQEIIGDVSIKDLTLITKIILCSGKVYYDLLAYKEEQKINNAALVRIEQLYPFNSAGLSVELLKYPNALDVVWCQEEPKNQGAWYSTKHNLEDNLRADQKLRYAGRKGSSAPATGYHETHEKEQHQLIIDAFKEIK